MMPVVATSGVKESQAEQQSFYDLIASERTTLRSVMDWEFSPSAPSWQLSKDHTLNLDLIMSRTPLEYRVAVRKMMAHYAATFSAASTMAVANALWKYFESTNGQINTSQLINFKSALGDNQEHLQMLRPFFRRWHTFGIPGVTKDVVTMMDGWRLRGREKGLAIKSMDPEKGALSDFEFAEFNDRLVFGYESGAIDLYDLCVCLILACTGRRPTQLTHLKCGDLISVPLDDGGQDYFLHIPRAKQEGGSFRDEFKTYQLTRSMWELLESHKQKVWQRFETAGFMLTVEQQKMLPLFPTKRVLPVATNDELIRALPTDVLHIRTQVFTQTLTATVESLGVISERTNDALHIFAKRFRYTLGTRAAREGVSKYVIAELLDHSDTQHVDVYTENVPEHLKKIDEALGFQLAVYAQAFAGTLVDSELDALRGSDPSSRIKHKKCGVGTCGNFSYCGMNAPRPCYTCVNFQPWLDGPHEELYIELIEEREQILAETGDLTVAAVLDRTIVAIAEVIRKCDERKRSKENE
ncbi:site-specific integrase [Pseudomonas mosselii]|uniref:site-specific integrase n=1 Tax=Pseudomonas TaxID=286 RepID=UPI001F490E88|nr:site-specific integrase [Pseudomonas mosselii]